MCVNWVGNGDCDCYCNFEWIAVWKPINQKFKFRMNIFGENLIEQKTNKLWWSITYKRRTETEQNSVWGNERNQINSIHSLQIISQVSWMINIQRESTKDIMRNFPLHRESDSCLKLNIFSLTNFSIMFAFVIYLFIYIFHCNLDTKLHFAFSQQNNDEGTRN